MSFYTDASLVMIPSGYKDGKVYCAKPIDGSADLTFSRGSDIEATRVASNGYIEKAKVNLLLQSNSFNSVSWTKTVTTVTSGQAGYDGTSDAWLLEATATSGSLRQNYSASGVFSFSSYAKAGSTNWIRISFIDAGSHDAWFDLSTGSVGTVTGINADITSVGAGWYRINIAANVSSSVTVRFYPASSDGTNGDAGDNVYIQDAQINYGLVAQEYQETTTTSVVSGITNDMPRLDYSGGASCPSLLLEGERTNLVISSEDIDSVWAKLRVSVENNNTTSPEGFMNAGKSTATAVSGTHASYDTFSGSVTAGNDYFISCFVKKATTKYIKLNEGYTGAYVTFNFDDQTTDLQSGASDVLLEEYANGWYRLGFKFTADSSGNSQFALYINDDNNNTSYIGSGEAVYLWGAQIEAGAYATSYIPNYGLLLGATRTADACSKTGISSLIGATEGTMFVEAKITLNGRLMLIGTTGNFIEILTTAAGKANAFVYNGSTQANILSTATYSSGDTLKIAFAYKANDFVLYVNGVQQGTDTSGAIPSSLAQLIINDYLSAGYNTANAYKQAILFPTRLSNADLATLTA